MSNRGLEANGSQAASECVHWEARGTGPRHWSWENPKLLRRSDAKVLLFFRASVSKSKLVVLRHL